MQYGIAARATNYDEILANIRKLIQRYHEAKAVIFYSQHTGLPSEYRSDYQRFWYKMRGLNPGVVYMAEGTRDWEIIQEVRPTEEDVVLKKHTASFFVGTPLEQMLRARGISTLVLSGVATEVGIEGTARHAAYLGFMPVVVEDAVGSSDRTRHESSIRTMREMFSVMTTENVLGYS